MSSVKFFESKNYLGKAMRQPGGTTARGAIKDAKRNLDTIRAECIAEVDAKLAAIHQQFGQAEEKPDDAALDELYRLCNGIVGLAGVFEMNELGEAAYCLCELVDRLKPAAHWDWPAVQVHLSGLRVLRRATPGAPENQAVLTGLRQLTARVDAQR
jgi:hypothetical protein